VRDLSQLGEDRALHAGSDVRERVRRFCVRSAGRRSITELRGADRRSLSRVFFSDDGSTAVEVALKMALQYSGHRGEPGRTRFAKLSGAYHGDTLGAVSVGGIDLFHAAFKPLLFSTLEVSNPFALRPTCGETDCEAGCIRALESLFEKSGKEIAALILEPIVQAAAGYIVHSPAYVRAARRICDEHGALLILDEIATGFGRTGPMWACEHAGVVPDLLCTAKGLTAGYLPLAATLATEEIYQAFLGPYEAMKTFFSTATRSPGMRWPAPWPSPTSISTRASRSSSARRERSRISRRSSPRSRSIRTFAEGAGRLHGGNRACPNRIRSANIHGRKRSACERAWPLAKRTSSCARSATWWS